MPAENYEVIVVGGGHAGCEAAASAARMGCRTLLLTMKKENLGHMSCNPAVGGIGKGQLVKEVDALGGLMGRAADYGGIHFKRLNMSKGPAVRSSRAQEDRKLFKEFIQNALEKQSGLWVKEGTVTSLIVKNARVKGVQLSEGTEIRAEAVVMTPGTFPGAMMYVGLKKIPGGRIGEPSSSISENLAGLGFKMMRFKTGTCPRLDGRTIDFSSLQVQKPDNEPSLFSVMSKKAGNRQVDCFITHTNKRTHDIIRENSDSSPLYTGMIKGTGVRYCPSIEDKLEKFSHMKKHNIFLEPEGLNTHQYYPNGISTSMPEKAQRDFIHSVKGLENARIKKYGYGIEYDLIDSRQLKQTLESKDIRDLYFAGQINGTTGYEEAAAQGLIAGVNAAASVKQSSPLVFDRDEAYIGVLIDDLVTRGTKEPYRMFTSRAEFRLLLREDNAHLRLTRRGYKCGCVPRKLYEKVDRFTRELEKSRNALKSTVSYKKKSITAEELLKNPEIGIKDLREIHKEIKKFPGDVLRELEIEKKYEGYIKRQEREIARMKELNSMRIPGNVDYSEVGSLSNEAREKLTAVRPVTIGQASRIPGITPAAVAGLMVYLRSRQ